jgi:hypothetical protein
MANASYPTAIVNDRTLWYEITAEMKALFVHWLVSTASLLVVAYLLPGIAVSGLGAALIASVVIGLVNATLGLF